jgi:hypothetical protein
VTPVVPIAPLVGNTVSAAFTVKVVEAPTEAESVAVMVWAPWAALGTVKVALQVPLAATVWVPLMV